MTDSAPESRPGLRYQPDDWLPVPPVQDGSNQARIRDDRCGRRGNDGTESVRKPRKKHAIDPKSHGHETDKPAEFCQDAGIRPASARVQARQEPDGVEMMSTPDWVRRPVAHGWRRA